MPFHFYLAPVMDQPNVASLFYGPVLLAAEEVSAADRLARGHAERQRHLQVNQRATRRRCGSLWTG